MSDAAIRAATAGDDTALAALDQRTWSALASPGPPPAPGRSFFDGRSEPADVLVAVAGNIVAGYVQIGPPTPVPSNRHVLMVRGLAVDPAWRGRGVGRRLVDGAIEEAARRGARRLTLRVLGPNAPARALYEAAGFVVEGVLRGEFLLDGRYLDDVLMARDLTPDEGAP